MSTRTAALMMLTDGRFPSGGHAYSAGMEQAIVWGDVVDPSTAEGFVIGRVCASGTAPVQVVAAANVACALGDREVRTLGLLDCLDEQMSARLASAASRSISREQGRRWLRAVRGTWPVELADVGVLTGGVDPLAGRHGVVVLGAATGYLAVTPEDAAMIALYDLVGTPISAAVRLLGLDPLEAASIVARLVARFEPAVRSVAIDAASMATALFLPDAQERATDVPGAEEGCMDLSWISWSTAPLSELAAEAHLDREERLFAS